MAWGSNQPFGVPSPKANSSLYNVTEIYCKDIQFYYQRKKILLSFVTAYNTQRHTIGIDATGFKSAFSQYYRDRTSTATSNVDNRRTFIKNTVSADTNRQLICSLKIRHSYCHDNIDFIPILSGLYNLLISLVIADKGYDDEKNHQFVREYLLADSIIPACQISRCSSMENSWQI